MGEPSLEEEMSVMRPLFSSSTQVHLEGPNQGGAVEMERTNGFQKR